GDPVLLKVEAVNRSNTARIFTPPLSTIRWNLQFECQPPGESEYRRIGRPLLSEPPRGNSAGWETEARHVSYDYLFRQMVWHGPYSPRPPRGVPQRHVFSTEGD